MQLIDKCLTHLTWLIKSLKEQNKILDNEIKKKLSDKVFILNKEFQRYYYNYSLYLKLFDKVDKGYLLLINNNKINSLNLKKIHSIYLTRAGMYFKTSGEYLKRARNEIILSSSYWYTLYSGMKSCSSLLKSIDDDFIFLIKNLI